LKPATRYLINPGSVGQPRDGDPRSAFATLDTSDLSVGLHRVEYDRKPVASGIAACGLPAYLAERLEAGF
jgi:diadenosine tetraphosphatase ApaH/serine/threonine PP2A family protein phosphatase